MKTEYLHAQVGPWKEVSAGHWVRTAREACLKINDRDVLVLQKESYTDQTWDVVSPYVLVPGYVVGQQQSDPVRTEIACIAEDDQETIETVVRNAGFEGEISFWRQIKIS